MEFPYLLLPGDRSGTPRPLVPVVYKYRKKETKPILTLVDSGADYSFVTFRIALYLGINLAGIEPLSVKGFEGSSMDCYSHETVIKIREKEMELPVYYGGSLTSEYPCILGQDVFFDKTKISFERYKWKFNVDFRK